MKHYLILFRFVLKHYFRPSFTRETLFFIAAILFTIPLVELISFKYVIDFLVEFYKQGSTEYKKFSDFVPIIICLFALLSVMVARYYCNVKKVKIINKMVDAEQKRLKMLDFESNWFRALILESSVSLLGISHVILVVAAFAFFVNLPFGGVSLAIGVVSWWLIVRFFKLEFYRQTAYVKSTKVFGINNSGMRILSRVTSVERSVIVPMALFYLLACLAIYMRYMGIFGDSELLMSLLLSRFYGTAFRQYSSSLMRLCRAFAYVRPYVK